MILPPMRNQESQTPTRYQPVDLLTMGYLLLVFMGIVGLGGNLDARASRLAVPLVLFIFVRMVVPICRRSRFPTVRTTIDFYPYVFFMFLYVNANQINTIIFQHPFDAWFRDMDQHLFGVEPAFWLHEKLGSRIIDEVLHLFYFTYYLQFIFMGIYIHLKSKEAIHYQRFIFVLCLTFYVSYIAFIVLPVHGPQSLRGDDYTGFVVVPIMNAIYEFAETGGGAFPSSHVAVSLVCLLFAGIHSRRLFAAWLLPFLGLTVATVYCRYHYAIDALAGIAWGLLFFATGLLIFNKNQSHPDPGQFNRSSEN